MSAEIWVDKYRPKYLDDIEYNKSTVKLLKAFSNNMPHLLFHGPNGSGKKTFVKALLRELYGDIVDHTRIQEMVYKTSSSEKEIHVLVSNYHYEINPSEAGSSDCKIIQDVVKSLVKQRSIIPCNFRVMVIENIDLLTEAAQYALRSIVEKSKNSAFRLILLTKDLNKVKDELQSRCKIIGIPSPTEKEIVKILSRISEGENLGLTKADLKEISKQCQRNVMRATLILQGAKVITNWEEALSNIASDIIKNPSVSTFRDVRIVLSDLLANCVAPSEIFEIITHELLKYVDEELYDPIIQSAALYEYQSNIGTHQIFSIEAYIASIIQIYRNWLISISSITYEV